MATTTSQLERLTFFSDAVFAIAITLLVIEVHVPHLATLEDAAYLAALGGLLPSFLGFALSFLTIGALWIAHHRVFGLLEEHDERLLWPNMLLLMVVAFMPFATALMSAQPRARVPEVFYAATLLLAGLLQHWLFRRALAPGRTRAEVPPAEVAALRWRSLGLPTAAALALVTAFWLPAWSDGLLLTIPWLVRLYAGLGRRHALRRIAASSPG